MGYFKILAEYFVFFFFLYTVEFINLRLNVHVPRIITVGGGEEEEMKKKTKM